MNSENYISFQNAHNPNYSKARRSNLMEDKWMMRDDTDKAGQVQYELSARGTKQDVGRSKT